MNASPTPAPCQVRSKTDSPCPNLAVAQIRGVAFCGPCAREQEAYFAIGEIVARGKMGDLRGGALAEALGRLRRESVGAREGVAARTRRKPSGVFENERPALRTG